MKEWAFGPFKKLEEPVLKADPTLEFKCPILNETVKWADNGVYNPCVYAVDGVIHMLYRADSKVSKAKSPFGLNKVIGRIGHATSTDGINFVPSPEPAIYPDNDEYKKYEWFGGCEDLHIIEDENGSFYMNYDAYGGYYGPNNGFGHTPMEPYMFSLLSATSNDMVNWKKEGFSINEKWENCINLSRSGNIICKEVDGRLVAAKIHGKYWMYMSHQGWLASSDDLIKWDPVFDEDGNIKCLFPKYPNIEYCSKSCEAGAAAILTEHGIVYFFNAAGPVDHGSGLEWTIGQALIDPNDLLTVLDVTEEPTLKPEYEWECHGHSNDHCVVCNTLFKLNGKWALYYGGGDSSIGCAIEE